MPDFVVESVGMLDTNCYIVPVAASRRVYIIDPGSEPDVIARAARKFDYDEAIILLTHAHVDHIGAVRGVMDELGIKTVYVHSEDQPLYMSPDNHLMPWVPAAKNLPEPVNEFDGDDFEIIETPGHTRGGVCFYFKGIPAVFVGDTIFAGAIGRTDLPGGNLDTLMNSIKEKILTLPDKLALYPGHGPATTVDREKRGNPFL
jgi:glyoxylase-like metal-dependent hydrolase (beta-lactamase superfamily II)